MQYNGTRDQGGRQHWGEIFTQPRAVFQSESKDPSSGRNSCIFGREWIFAHGVPGRSKFYLQRGLRLNANAKLVFLSRVMSKPLELIAEDATVACSLLPMCDREQSHVQSTHHPTLIKPHK